MAPDGLSNSEIGAQLFLIAHRPIPPEKVFIKLSIDRAPSSTVCCPADQPLRSGRLASCTVRWRMWVPPHVADDKSTDQQPTTDDRLGDQSVATFTPAHRITGHGRRCCPVLVASLDGKGLQMTIGVRSEITNPPGFELR
jgi:hypothetical protein